MTRTSVWKPGILAAVCFFVAAAESIAQSRPAPVNYTLRNFPGIPVHVVTVDMNSTAVSVQPQMAAGGPGSVESFRSMLRRTRPAAAITGAFFDTKSKFPVGDIAVNGQVVHKGVVGNGISITPYGEVRFVPRAEGVKNNWQGYQTVLCGGPTLVNEGKIVLDPRKEGFRDPGLFGKRPRTAVGHTQHNKLILVSINKPVSLERLALIMQALGSQEAITLDGGSSTGLWFNGRILSSPSRQLTNVLAVHVRKPEAVAASGTSKTQ